MSFCAISYVKKEGKSSGMAQAEIPMMYDNFPPDACCTSELCRGIDCEGRDLTTCSKSGLTASDK